MQPQVPCADQLLSLVGPDAALPLLLRPLRSGCQLVLLQLPGCPQLSLRVPSSEQLLVLLEVLSSGQLQTLLQVLSSELPTLLQVPSS